MIFRPSPEVALPCRRHLRAHDGILIAATALGICVGSAHGQRQLPLRPINLLPNAPATYQMRDWRAVAADFDALAFDTAAAGQFLPLSRRDDAPSSSYLTVAYGLPSYVGEVRTYGNGDPVTEGIATLGAVLGSTLIGVDKATGPINWVSMTREYYINRNQEFIVMNNPDAASGQSAWYEVFPNILFYSIADRYPDEAYLEPILDVIDARFYGAINKMTAGGAAPNFNYTAYDFSDAIPRYNGVWREPDMGLGMAWLQHAAYWRNRTANPSAAANHLQAVDWAFKYYEPRTSNPNYEVLASFGAYAAARMNADHERNLNIHKYLDWVFSRSAARPDLIMISGERWGGQDVGGLLGGMRPNTPNVQGYAFAMNTYANAMPVVPIARYEDRYSRAIGKWVLNAANASRLFYGNAHGPNNQSSEFWTEDPQHAIAYEGLRHNWLPPHLLAPGESQEIFAAGDPLTYDWGPLTDFGIYGSGFVGVWGSVVRTTNVDKVLQLDLLATDFYRDAAYPTYLYYNPHPTDASVAIDLPAGGSFDLYDAVSNRFLQRSAAGSALFNIPADEAVMLVLAPTGKPALMAGRKLLVDGVVIDYNAALLPGNLLRNPDVDEPTSGATTPADWHRSASALWATDLAQSPTHSLQLDDSSPTRTDEWRSSATAIPAGVNRVLDVRWFWKYDAAAEDEFVARLRFSPDPVAGIDLTSPSLELIIPASGAADGLAMFQTAVPLPDGIRSFDVTFISGASPAATGSMYIDDISASLRIARAAGDFDDDGDVDGSDFLLWQASLAPAVLPGAGADGNHDGRIDEQDLALWKSHSPAAAAPAGPGGSAIPEPASPASLLAVPIALSAVKRNRRARFPRRVAASG
ncbi:MAG: hypothetical protein DCC67_06070 [Planctomycetota bacterium]|nr:MAG: hypothetical protein DCC67_06070 [Planctomycetota bacterium]